MLVTEISKELTRFDKTKLFYHVYRLINVYCRCISRSITPDILAIVYGEGHPWFFHCYEITICSWFIYKLTKLLCSFICHCLQCLVLQTKRHLPYKSLSLLELPFVPFFILTLDFVLMLPLSKEEFNVIIQWRKSFLNESREWKMQIYSRLRIGPMPFSRDLIWLTAAS